MTQSTAVRSLRLMVAVFLATALGLTLTAGPAAAAPNAPTNLTPNGTAASGTPVLSWDRVGGATSYQVEYSRDSDFGSGVTKVTTVNQRYVPKTKLPAGELWWRVRTVASSGTSEWSIASFDVDGTAGPTLLAPSDGTQLDQPEDPVLLSWSPVDGAASYTVEVDDSIDFQTPVKTDGIKTTSYILANPQVATAYNWRVKAVFDGAIESGWSEVRTFTIGGLGLADVVYPVDDPTNVIDDVVLSWTPVDGAVEYDLQVATADSFAPGTVTETRNGIRGTTYSPATTYANDQYYWRVRAVDAFGNEVAWNAVEIWEFRRAWPDQPALQYPGDGDVVGDPFYYEWSPTSLASTYTIELSESTNFTNPLDRCTTTQTTYVPRANGDCWPGASGTFYWRVLVNDAPAGVPSERDHAEIRMFSYDPEIVDITTISPAIGATGVTNPLLTWEPVPGAARYRVSLTAVDGGTGGFANRLVTTTSYSPVAQLTPGATYRWNVVTVSHSGRIGSGLVLGAQPFFTVADEFDEPAATGPSPEPLSPASGSVHPRFPALQWTPVEGASFYKIEIRNADGIAAFESLSPTFRYGSGQDYSNSNLPGNIEWQISAYDAQGELMVTGDSRVFTITPPSGIDGFRTALIGSETNGANCTKTLPARCEDLRQTPVFRWDPVEQAGSYRLWISRDPTFTNVVIGGNFGLEVDGTMFSPTAALPDSQAADAYYWQVVPCTFDDACAPRTNATHAFNKKSNPIEVISPAVGAEIADTVTFTWNGFLDTNLNGFQFDDQGEAADPSHLDETGVPATLDARQYVVEVSTVPNFQSLVDSITVDQRAHTASTKFYPEGLLYWRVTARDASNNLLTSSRIRSFTKKTPPPVINQLNGGAPITQTVPFTWEPAPYASAYDLEIYRNGDTLPSPANRVVALNGAKQSALTLPNPLAPSSTPYTWRIRKVDASGNKGPWTSLTHPFASFRVNESAPVQVSPESGADVGSNAGYFTWNGVQGARSYRFERRRVGQDTITESVVTSGLAWAPTAAIADGAWQWRVVALGSDNAARGASPWRAFSVDATAPRVVKTSPGNGATRVKLAKTISVTFSEPVVGFSKASVKLRRAGKKKVTPAGFSLNAAGTVGKINPTGKLVSRATYTVTITSRLKDRKGFPIATTRWTFTTK